MKKIFSSILFLTCLVGCTTITNFPPKHVMVIGIQKSTISVNDSNLAGAVIGGVAGGMVGHQFGKDHGKTAMTVFGALGGATVISQINAQKLVPGYKITVRANDGEVITFNSQNYVPVGQMINYKN